MENTTDTTDVVLTVEELIAELNLPIAGRTGAGAGKVGAVAAIRAATSVVEVVRRWAERLLTVTLPQALEFMSLVQETKKEYEAQGMCFESEPYDETGKTWGNVIKEVQSGVDGLATNGMLPIKRAYHLALLRNRLNKKMSADETRQTLKWAVEKGYLVAQQGSTKYSVADGFALAPEDKVEIGTLANSFAIEIPIPALTPAAPVEKKPCSSTTEIGAKDAWNGKLGRFKLAYHGKKPGYLTLEAQEGGNLLVVQGCNGCADLENWSLPLTSIKSKDGSIREAIKLVPPVSLVGKKLEDWQYNAGRLAEAIKKGFTAVLTAKDLTPHDFLTSQVQGEANLTFSGSFKWELQGDESNSAVFTNLTLRFSRRFDGQIALVKIVSEQPNAEKLFGEAIGKFSEPGVAFMDLKPLPCSVFLRAVYGQVVLRKNY